MLEVGTTTEASVHALQKAMHNPPVIMSPLGLRKIKVQQLVDAKSRLERKRKEVRCW